MPSERDRLVESGLGLVRSIATTIIRGLPRQVSLDDLVGAGTRGLVEAADRYDPSRGVQFTTFAYYRIRGAIYDEIRRIAWIPRRDWERQRFLEKADEIAEAAVAEGSAPPRGEDAARTLSKTVSQIAIAYVATVDAFDQTPSEDVGPEEALAERQDRGEVRAAIQKLPDKERQLLEMHYFEDLSLLDAGKRLGLSKSWASRLHARALRLLQAQLGGEAPR
jgi:RNA polymerase sigma factor for flagellar operon FliA